MKALSKRHFIQVFGLAATKIEHNYENDYVSCKALGNAVGDLVGPFEGLAVEHAVKKFYAFYVKPRNKAFGDRWFGRHFFGDDFIRYQNDRIENQKKRATALRLVEHMIKTNPNRYYKQYLKMVKENA